MAKKLIVIATLILALAAGCNNAVLGNIAVLAISIGIFFGTLSLSGHVAKTASIGHYTDRLSKPFANKTATGSESENKG
jgi:hypothetical protein